MPVQIMELRLDTLTELSIWLLRWVPTPKFLTVFLTQLGFNYVLWCSWQPQLISPQPSLQRSLETSRIDVEPAPQSTGTAATPHSCVPPSQHGHAVPSRSQRQGWCRPQCKSLLQQPDSPPLAPFSVLTPQQPEPLQLLLLLQIQKPVHFTHFRHWV